MVDMPKVNIETRIVLNYPNPHGTEETKNNETIEQRDLRLTSIPLRPPELKRSFATDPLPSIFNDQPKS